MPYFHVLVATEPKPERLRCIMSDLSEKELKEAFVVPFKRGKGIVAGHELIRADQVRKLKITSTDEPSCVALDKLRVATNEALDRQNQESRGVVFLGGIGFGLDDLGKLGSDVTHIYIKVAPESSPTDSPQMRMINNPWVTGIVGGVVVAGIAAYLKWN